MTAGGHRLLATGLAATALVQAGNAFTAWDRALADRLLLAAVFALVGAAIVSRRGANAFGWTCLAIGCAGAALSVAGPAGLEPWFALFPLVLLVFPSGRLPSRRWAGALLAAVAAPVCLALGADAAEALAVVALVLALASLAARLRHPCEIVRRRVLCLLLGSAAALFAFALDVICLPGAWALGALAIPAAAGVALLCDPIHELDLALDRLLVCAGLTLGLIAAYGAGVVLLLLTGCRLPRSRCSRHRCSRSGSTRSAVACNGPSIACSAAAGTTPTR